jgi:hypothetical protein
LRLRDQHAAERISMRAPIPRAMITSEPAYVGCVGLSPLFAAPASRGVLQPLSPKDNPTTDLNLN